MVSDLVVSQKKMRIMSIGIEALIDGHVAGEEEPCGERKQTRGSG